nr:zf-TFIIB domain-containing protein [uncultured Rhodoferax sp.]
MKNTPTCPSCRNPMQMHALPGNHGHTVELDLCFQCQGMWFDPQENLKLTPAAVAELFKVLHAQRGAAHHPLSTDLDCPRCRGGLTKGFDLVRSGRYITYRCGNGHGRFSPFSSFMVEKGFVRQLTRPEIEDIAKRVAVIHCSSCGAPADIRKDAACTHCRSAFSLLDPKAVEKALEGYAHASKSTGPTAAKAPDVADALIMLERDKQRAQREQQAQTGRLFTSNDSTTEVDLWSIGIALIASVLDD